MPDPRTHSEPRPLTEAERSILDAMLSVDIEGVEDLRSQARDVLVSGGCGCGCPSIHFNHPQDEVGKWHRVDAAIAGIYDGILLFTSGRWLDSMEYVWTSDVPPTTWPEVHALSITPCS